MLKHVYLFLIKNNSESLGKHLFTPCPSPHPMHQCWLFNWKGGWQGGGGEAFLLGFPTDIFQTAAWTGNQCATCFSVMWFKRNQALSWCCLTNGTVEVEHFGPQQHKHRLSLDMKVAFHETQSLLHKRVVTYFWVVLHDILYQHKW